MTRDHIHVALLPWSAFGHIFPFFQLSIALAKVGVHSSLISTTKNIQRLPKLPPDFASLIALVAFPLPSIDRNLLPEDAEATVDIPFEKIQYLKIAYDLLRNPIKHFIADQSPDWIISDLLSPWVDEIAREANIPVITFYAFSAATTVFVGPPEYLSGENQKQVRPSPESLTIKPQWVDFPSTIAYRIHEAIGIHAGIFGENASGITDGQRYARVINASKAVAIRSCPEFESDYFNLQEKITGKPAIPLGFLPPERSTETKSRVFTDHSWKRMFQWLDAQKPKSVVFVGFGTECKLTKDQIHEIAYGLEISGLHFVWALQKSTRALSEDTDSLPSDFSSRICGKGMVHIGWAPQREILVHPSIGVCLFHAGWGSVIESLQFGHRLVVLPFIIDQGLNARLLVEKGLAIEVERSEDGSFSKGDIAESLRRAMLSNEDEGEGFRERAANVSAIFGDQKLNDYYIERFVEYLKTNRVQN